MSNTSSSARLSDPLRAARARQGAALKSMATRTVFSISQMAYLQSIFAASRHPCLADREVVASRLGVRERVVRVWFQNRRQEMRREHEGLTKAALLLLEMSTAAVLSSGTD